MNIYDSKNFKLIIGPFDYDCIEGAEILMTFPDKFLLKVKISYNIFIKLQILTFLFKRIFPHRLNKSLSISLEI